jgi:tetratricopeptide (TPR) repeat protein
MRHLIGLGFRCDVAFQLRMHGQENVAHFFDWLSTPLEGVIKIIEADFDVFHPDHLILATDQAPHYVKDQVTGVHFYHQFPLFAGNVQPDFLLFYESFIKKFGYLAERFRNYLRTKPVTLVRQGKGLTPQQAQQLEEVVLTRFPGADVRFLYIQNKGEEFQTANGRARVFKNDGSSLGHPGEWSKMLAEEGLIDAPYQHATVEILGSAHDDYNLMPDNRFSEAQLLAAIGANPQNQEYPLELSRWYMARGMFAKAEDMAIGALARAPRNLEAIFQATLAQRATHRFDAQTAAEAFIEIAGSAKPAANWQLEASIALLDAGRIDEALYYAQRAAIAAPLNHRAYFYKARCLLAKRDFVAAERAISLAMSFGYFPPVYLHVKARALEGMGRLEEAILSEQHAVEKGEKFLSLFNLAQLLSRAGRLEDALEAYQAALPVAGAETAKVEALIETARRGIISADDSEDNLTTLS